MAVILSFLTRPAFWLALAAVAGVLFFVARYRGLRWRPAWALRLALAALSLAAIFAVQVEPVRQETPPPQVMVIDASDSIAEEAQASIRLAAREWQAGGDHRALVVFGAQPQVILSSAQAGAPETWPEVDGRASDLAGALELAGELLGGRPGRVILATDGRVSDPGAVGVVVDELVAQGHSLDGVQLAPRQDAADGFVGALWAPSNLWAGTPFEVFLPIYPPLDGSVSALRLSINGQPTNLPAEAVEANLYRFQIPAQPEGITTLQAVAEFSTGEASAADPFPENNAAYSTLQVFAAPGVLFVSNQPLTPQADHLVQTLRQNNLQVDVFSPEAFPTSLEQLAPYRVIFLNNLLSNQLNNDQMLSLQVFSSRLAGGVVFLGGRSSYTLGGYKDTLLESMLPVKLEPPPRSERPPVVFALVMDHSSSMSISSFDGGPAPMELAREAAMRAIETMRPQDYLGVLGFATEFEWTVPFRELGSGLSLRQALDAVSQVEAFGSTHMFAAMQEALAAFQALPPGAPASRHLLVLSDGKSYDGNPEELRALAEAAQAQGITISTIAFGEGADALTMEEIAEAGKGRFYSVMQADELPRILIYESQAARSENVQTGQTALKLGEQNHPLLSGLSPNQLPNIAGYNALTSRTEEGAEDILISGNFDDPILSAWQYGLGRVVAWTSDLGEEWVGSWTDPAGEALFWSQVVRYALVNPALGPAQVNVLVEDTRLVVEAYLSGADGEPANLSQVRLSYAGEDGQVRAFSLPQVGAGAYRLELPRPPEGAYRAVLTYGSADAAEEVAAPFAVNPPPEWLPVDPSQGPADLAAWARAAGGQVASVGDLLEMDAAPEPDAADSAAPRWRYLVAALLLLWPAEIAIRRKWLPWI